MTVTEAARENNLLQLEVQVTEADYQEAFDQQVRTYRQKMNLPGFRKGQIPASLVKKQYGKSILYQEISNKAMEAMYEHLKAEQIDTFGSPVLAATDLGDPEKMDHAA